MTGYDSSDDKSPESVAMQVLAVFSTSYNLPIYLRYNTSYRRTFLRMMCCRTDQNTESETSRIAAAADRTTGIRDAADKRQATCSRSQQHNDEPSGSHQPSTNQDRACRTHTDAGRLTVRWVRQPNSKELDASDCSVTVQRY